MQHDVSFLYINHIIFLILRDKNIKVTKYTRFLQTNWGRWLATITAVHIIV